MRSRPLFARRQDTTKSPHNDIMARVLLEAQYMPVQKNKSGTSPLEVSKNRL